MTFYMGIIILTELLMLTMIVHVLNYSGFTKTQKAWFLLSFLTVMFCAAAEFCAVHFNSRGPEWRVPLTVLTVIQFTLTPILPIAFTGALGLRREAAWAGSLVSLNGIAQIALAPFGLIFYFDEGGSYVRGDLYIIYEISYGFGMVFLLAGLFAVGRRFRRRDAVTIVMILIIMLSGVIPLILFKTYADYVCIAISGAVCYIYYNDLVQQDIKAELVKNQKKASSMQGRIISSLSNLIESRDTDTGEHVSRTAAIVRILAENAAARGVYADELTPEFIDSITRLAPMHDIGKIVVSDRILRKPGKLTPEEFEEMKRHAARGGEVIRGVLSGMADEGYMRIASDLASFHHERWDGAGYPEGMAGEKIPLAARIMALADVFDALVSERCYKKAMPADEAFEVIRAEAGTHFDPRLAEVFLACRNEILAGISGKETA